MSFLDNITKNAAEIRESIERGEEKALGESIVEGLETFYSNTIVPRVRTSEYLRSATGWVYGCVNVIADELAAIQITLKRFKNGEMIEVDDHEALDVLYRANNAMTKFDFFQLIGQYLELTGEAPFYVSFVNNKPDQLLLLRPDRLEVKPGKNGEIIGGYKYKVYGNGGYQELDLEPYEVVPLKYSDPNNVLRGKGPLEAAAMTFDLDNYGEKWNAQFFKNSAAPSGALQTDKVLSADVRKRLEKKLKENYQGTDNAHKTMILENGLKFEQVSLSQKDMDFIEQQRFSRDKILAIFRVPRTALGITDDVNRANAEATDYVFAKRTIKPKMERIIQQLNEFYLPLFGKTEDLFFDFKDPVPQDRATLVKEADTGVRGGFMTVNEARALMGLDPVDGGDELKEPTAPLAPGAGQESIRASKSLIVERSAKKLPSTYQKHLYQARTRKSKDKEKKKESVSSLIQSKLTPMVFSMLQKKFKNKKLITKSIFKGATPEEIKEDKLKFQDKQLNVADKYEDEVIKKLDSVFDTQKDIILRGLDSGDKMKLDTKVEKERYLNAIKKPMMDLMKEQAFLAFQILGVTNPFSDTPETPKAAAKKPKTFLQRLADYFERRTFVFAQQVVRETNKKLQVAFKEGTAAGESIPQLKKRITALFEEMKGFRSERIARTETILASNFSTESAYKESGVVEGKEWLTTRDERTDDECAELDGKIVSLGGKFFEGDYFSGDYPPLHANCRCTLIPVIKAG